MLRTSFLAVLAIGLIAQPASSHGLLMKLDGQGDVIRGQLYYSNGNQAAGEWVEISDHAAPAAPETLQTKADGRFTFKGQRGHSYLVKATGEEGHEISMDITLAEDARAKMIETPADRAAKDIMPPAWAVVGGLLLLSAIPALWLRRHGDRG